MTTNEVVARRLFDPSFSPSEYFQALNLLGAQVDALVQGVPYLSHDQLVELDGILFSTVSNFFGSDRRRTRESAALEKLRNKSGQSWLYACSPD